MNKKLRNNRYLGFRKLTTRLHFHTAIIEGKLILAFQDAELIGSGRIEAFEEQVKGEAMIDDIVVINGERFIRSNCMFVYAK